MQPTHNTHTHSCTHYDAHIVTHTHTHTHAQWYVSAVSGSKAVYVLVHSVQNASFSLMQRAAEDIISTLTHRDFIQVQFAGSIFNMNDFQRSDNFTRENVRSFVRSRQFSPVQTDLTQAFRAAFGMFQDSQTTTSTCHRTLILFTDSALQQNLADEISQLEQSLRSTGYSVDVYTYSFGGITTDPTIAQQIACDNQGQWFPVNSQSELESTIHSYYNFYAASVQNSGVVWSELLTDVLTQQVLISACLPLYDPATVESAPRLLGVTCVEVDPQRFYDFPDGILVMDITRFSVCFSEGELYPPNGTMYLPIGPKHIVKSCAQYNAQPDSFSVTIIHVNGSQSVGVV